MKKKNAVYYTKFLNSLSHREISNTIPNVIEQILKNIDSALQKIGSPALTEDFTQILKGQLSTIEQPDHKIRLIVGKSPVCYRNTC